ncbi:MAG: alanine racemase [Clostridia bacterium]|nr:alanine racemase [Clostridia bacterium]
MLDNTRAWAEINLDAIAHNAAAVRAVTSPGAKLIGVVKADAYGHGAVQVAGCLIESGADMLAVSQIDEALQLRLSGIKSPILILSDAEPERAEELIRYSITQTVFAPGMAKSISDAAVRTGKKAIVHIKIDSGMGRVGFRAEEPDTVKKILDIARLPNIEIEGIFTHFAVSDEAAGGQYTQQQFAAFTGVCDALRREGLDIPVRHAANSAAILRYPEMHLDAVRAGIILYGMYPSEASKAAAASLHPGFELKPAMSFKAKITAVKRVPAGTYLSYGCTYRTENESVIATVPVGYADGYARSLGGRAEVLVHGRRAPVRGRVCMDQCLVDVTDLSASGIEVRPGDEAVLFGAQGNGCISPEELAALENTINYEIICSLSKRIPRKFIRNGVEAGVSNVLLDGCDNAVKA